MELERTKEHFLRHFSDLNKNHLDNVIPRVSHSFYQPLFWVIEIGGNGDAKTRLNRLNVIMAELFICLNNTHLQMSCFCHDYSNAWILVTPIWPFMRLSGRVGRGEFIPTISRIDFELLILPHTSATLLGGWRIVLSQGRIGSKCTDSLWQALDNIRQIRP